MRYYSWVSDHKCPNWSIFIRSMMVKHAENIRPDGYECKSHQLRIIGILVAVYIFTICGGVSIVLAISRLSPFDFMLVRSCRQVDLFLHKEEIPKAIKAWMARLFSLFIYSLAIISSHGRIIFFKRRHNMSYFSQFRQTLLQWTNHWQPLIFSLSLLLWERCSSSA